MRPPIRRRTWLDVLTRLEHPRVGVRKRRRQVHGDDFEISYDRVTTNTPEPSRPPSVVSVGGRAPPGPSEPSQQPVGSVVVTNLVGLSVDAPFFGRREVAGVALLGRTRLGVASVPFVGIGSLPLDFFAASVRAFSGKPKSFVGSFARFFAGSSVTCPPQRP